MHQEDVSSKLREKIQKTGIVTKDDLGQLLKATTRKGNRKTRGIADYRNVHFDRRDIREAKDLFSEDEEE